METHVMSRRDGSDYLYEEVVTAPTYKQALRVFAMHMLEETEATLEESGEKSLEEYAHQSSLIDDRPATDGDHCPACGGAITRRMTRIEIAAMAMSPIEHHGRMHVCRSCAYGWLSLGHVADARGEIEIEAMKEIERLDAFEEASLMGEAP